MLHTVLCPRGLVQRAKQREVVRKIDRETLSVYKQCTDEQERRVTLEAPYMWITDSSQPQAKAHCTNYANNTTRSRSSFKRGWTPSKPKVFRNHADKQHQQAWQQRNQPILPYFSPLKQNPSWWHGWNMKKAKRMVWGWDQSGKGSRQQAWQGSTG